MIINGAGEIVGLAGEEFERSYFIDSSRDVLFTSVGKGKKISGQSVNIFNDDTQNTDTKILNDRGEVIGQLLNDDSPDINVLVEIR